MSRTQQIIYGAAAFWVLLAVAILGVGDTILLVVAVYLAAQVLRGNQGRPHITIDLRHRKR